MTKRRKKFKIPYFTVQCDDYAVEEGEPEEAQDADGTSSEEPELLYPRVGEWVKFRKRMPAKLIKLSLQVLALQESDEEGAEVEQKMEEALDQLIPMLAKVVHSWNWTDIWDEERPPLPDPDVATLWLLDIEEIFYLVTKLLGRTQVPKAPASP